MPKFLFKLILVVVLCTFRTTLFACDESTATLTSLTDNGDGTYTVVLDVCTEFLGLEATPYSWSIDFNDPLNIISATPATLTTGTGDNYNLSLSGGTATWTCGGFLPSNNSSLFCYTLTLVLDAQPTTSVDVITNNDAASSFANCTHTLTFPPPPPVCNISAVTGTPSACNPANNSYTADVTVTYSNAPGSGNIVVNGQTFPVTTSPQTVTLTGLTSNGNNVNVTANFSADPTCTFTQNNAFTAPSPCTCSITAVTGTPSACNPADDSYTASVTVTYSNPPGSGNLVVNGQTFPVTASPQTITLTGLTSDGNSVNLVTSFSADPTCTFTQNIAYTAPSPCSGGGCVANAGTISQ